MGVYIPNMEKPKSCWECPFYDSEYPWTCDLFDAYCPLIEIVTCGECKWSYIDEKYEGTLWCKVHFHHYRVNSDGFCNYGERANNTRIEQL